MLNKLYILLPVHNRKEVTRLFIECLCRQTFTDFHLILIDDGSTDGTSEMVIDYIEKSKLTIIKGSGDWWWAGSLQHGINWLKQHVAQDSFVLFINDDVTFQSNFIEIGVEHLRKTERTILLARLFDENTGEVKESGVSADLECLTFNIANENNAINCLSTRGLLMRLADVIEIGDFYPSILPHYWSDYEFTIRAYKKNYSLLTCKDFYLNEDKEKTGLRTIEFGEWGSFFTSLFSKRSVHNPIYKSVFIILSCPLSSRPFLMVKVWLNLFWLLKRQVNFNSSLTIKKVILKLKLFRNKKELNVILGASTTTQEGWVPTNYSIIDVLDINVLRRYFAPSSVNAFLAEHVWEHLTEDEGLVAAKNCFEMLRPGGNFRIAVPDGYHIDMEYIDDVKPNGKGVGSDDHKVLYNYKSLSMLLEKAGFQISLLEWFDESGCFNSTEWTSSKGFISRSTRFDERNFKCPTKYTSLIIDALKPSS